MLTIFATPKPFKNHIATIQRNAITSWTLLRPRPEVILFGEEEGTAEIAAELGLRHVPTLHRNEKGIPLVNSPFASAQTQASNNLLCYANADIILLSDFMAAVERVAAWRDRFLMVGRKWDIDIDHVLNFEQPNWERDLRAIVLERGRRREPDWIDYFLFPRSLYKNIPPFALGRMCWDNWLVWNARASHSAVVDASSVVLAIHQNHDYSHDPQGIAGVRKDAKQNFKLAGGWTHLFTIEDATYLLTTRGFQKNRLYWLAPTRRRCRPLLERLQSFGRVHLWHPMLDATRPVRHRLGLRQRKLAESAGPAELSR